MRERAEAMVLASFVADSHALGTHGLYDIAEIRRRFGRVDRLLPAAPGSVLGTGERGTFTLSGYQALHLLRHLAEQRGFLALAYLDSWRSLMSTYRGHLDEAAERTLANLETGLAPMQAASHSSDLSVAGRIAPLAYLLRDDRALLLGQAESVVRTTHNDSLLRATARGLALAVWNSLNGKTPTSALRAAGGAIEPRDEKPSVAELIEEGLASVSSASEEAAVHFGQGGDTRHALPLSVHLIAKYEGSLRQALEVNAGLGGNTSARGMIVGMILGAFHGRDAIPDEWLTDMVAYRKISTLLEDLEACLQRSAAAG